MAIRTKPPNSSGPKQLRPVIHVLVPDRFSYGFDAIKVSQLRVSEAVVRQPPLSTKHGFELFKIAPRENFTLQLFEIENLVTVGAIAASLWSLRSIHPRSRR